MCGTVNGDLSNVSQIRTAIFSNNIHGVIFI